MIQKFNSNNKLLQAVEENRQDILNKLTNSKEPLSADEFGDMLETLRRADRMIYNILMTGNNTNE